MRDTASGLGGYTSGLTRTSLSTTCGYMAASISATAPPIAWPQSETRPRPMAASRSTIDSAKPPKS
jgi:hypothetical protein